MKLKNFAAGLLFALAIPAQGALYWSDSTAGTIADNSIIGLTRSTTISDPAWNVTGVTLTFTLSGGFGTDLTGYLRAGNLESSPSFDLTSYLNGISLVPNTPTTYNVNVGSSFIGINPNTTWTLFFADQGAGGTTSFSGWSLDISAVPEPTEAALGLFGLVGGLAGLVRWQRNRRAA